MSEPADIAFGDPFSGVVFDPGSGVQAGPSLGSGSGPLLGTALDTLKSGDIIGSLADLEYAADRVTGGRVSATVDSGLAVADKATKPLQALGGGLLSHPLLVVGGVLAAVFLLPIILREVL